MRKVSMSMYVIIAFWGILPWFTPEARAQVVLRVPIDFPAIQGAIKAAADGDTILVAPGTYVENLNFLGKAITVTSESGPELTIVDGNRAGSVVTFSSGEGAASILRGFTLQNGFASFGDPSYGDGGGINIQSSSPSIERNIVTNNQGCSGAGIMIRFGSPSVQWNSITSNAQAGCSGGTGGGGIGITGSSSAQILGNVISENTTGSGGGGISLFAAGTPKIQGNIIRGNVTPGDGGGISLVSGSDAIIIQNLITGNSGRRGGGISWLVPSGNRGPLLVNNTIADNNGPEGSGIYADGYDAGTELANNIVIAQTGQAAVFCGNFNDLNPPTFRSNNIYSSSGSAYEGICTDQTGINGNISADPGFADPASGNYHVQWPSPVIDKGDNTISALPDKDIDDDMRIIDGDVDSLAVVDMGVDEYAPGVPAPASLKVPVADTDGVYTVTWGASLLEGVKYILHEATSPNFSTGLRVAYAGMRRIADITERSQGTTYYYRVKARKAGYADSAWQTLANGCAVPGETAATMPASLTVPASDSDGAYTVIWTASTTADVMYVLEEATTPTFTAALRVVYTGPGLRKAITGRAQNQTYYYRVKAVKPGVRDSVWRLTPQGCAVPGMTMVAKPASITVPVSDADGVFTVNWGISVTASITYVLEEAVDPLFKAGLRVVYCGTALSTEIAGRIQNRTYYYRVKAIKPGLIDSVWRVAGQGCAVPGTTRVISPAGIEVPVADTDGSYTVNWAATATAGATYVLEEATNPVFNASLQIVYSGAALSKSITGRVQNQTYYYRVKAIKPGVKDSNWLVATNGCAVPGSVAVVAPATLAVPANDVNGTYVVSWDASSTPSVSYRLEEATNDTFTQELRTVYFGAEKAAVITGRTFGKTYYYRVRAQRPGYRDSNWRQAAMGVAIVLPPGPDATDYFPNATGDTWFYNLLEMEDGGVPVTDLSRLSVAGTRIVLGQVASVFQERAHSDNRLIEYYFSKDQSGVMNLGNNDPEDTLSPQLIPYRELVFPLQVGLITQFTKSGLDYGSDLDGDTLNERINLTLQSSITGVEPVQVPAGSFPNAGKRLTVIDGEVILSYSGFTIPFSGSDETWSVAGTGVVKQTSTTTADTISITSMAEVRGYIVGGIGRGMGWPATIAGSLSPGDGYGPVPVGNPVVASDGTNYLIMVRKATRLASEWRAQWVGILVDPDGVVIKTFNVTSPTRIYDSESGMKAAVAFDGNSYLFVYEQDNNFASSGLRPSLTGVRLSPAGMLIGSSVAVAPSGSDSPALAFDGTNFLLTYRYRHQISGLYQIYGALVSSTTGQVTGAGGVPFTSAPGYQEDPVVAFDGTNYLVVWDQGLWEAQGQTPGIYAVRITPEGTVLDPGSFVVFDNNIQSVPTKSSNPAIAFDGNNYLVAYEYSPENLNTQLAATRITKEGQLLDGTPITGGFSITTNHNGFAGDVTLTFSGNEYWAAWASSPGIGIYDGIFGARIGTDGTVKSPGSNGMRMGPKTQSYYPAITANSSGGYLVWLNSFSNSVPCEAIGMSIYPFEP